MVSTNLQNYANPHFELETFACKNNIKIDEFIEQTFSSQKTLSQRNLLGKLGKGDKIIITKISILG